MPSIRYRARPVQRDPSRLVDFDFWTARPRRGVSGVGPYREPGEQLDSS
jgi:hypothetical protein